MNSSPISALLTQLDEYKRRFYLNRLIKGLIFAGAVIFTAFLVFNTLEYFGHFGKTFRGFLFFSFLIALLGSLFFWVIKPLIFLYGPQKPLSNEEAAQQIGQFFPEVGDKLINTLQLSKTLDGSQNELLQASIRQKTKQLGIVRFADAIKIQDNKRYVKFAAVPAALIALLLLLYPAFFADSSNRIVNFSNEFQEKAPFSFRIENEKLEAFKNEDFTVKLALQGNTVPASVYLLLNGRKLKMETPDQKHYAYTFSKVQQPFEFIFEAAGFKSSSYDVELIQRPNLAFFDVSLNYPSYLGKSNETLKNTGNLTIPEGTVVDWAFSATETDSILLKFDGDAKRYLADKKLISGNFELARSLRTSGSYQVFLKNQHADNREGINYFINVVPDKFPQIALEQYKDSTLYNFLVLGGNITDDYGISRLAVFYKILREGKADAKLPYRSVNLPNSKANIQSFSFPWSLDSLKLNTADKIEYYVQVWDNDGVNGAKATRTATMNYLVPDNKAIQKEIDNSVDKTEAQLDKTLDKAKKLEKEIKALESRLKNKKDFDFQDKKLVEEVMKKREELLQEIKELQNQNQALTEKQQRFNEMKPEMQQKMEALQKLMNDLMQEENQKLYEDLKKMLEQNQDEKMLDMLDKLKNKENNTEKDLDRLQNLFKKLQRDQKLDKTIEDLKKQAENQEKLAEKTEQADKKADQSDKKTDQSDKKTDPKINSKDKKTDQAEKKPDSDQKSKENDALKKEQEKLQKDFENTKKSLEEVEKMNKEMKEEQKMDMDKESQEDISKDQQDSKENLEKQDNKESSKKQKKAARQMRNLAQKLSEMKASSEMKQNEENMDDLRDILENLVKLSFDQERLMKDFRGLNPADPRFIKLSQEQLNLQDDAKVIEDSLYALSKRVLQIESFVTREMGNMKSYMNEATNLIKERKIGTTTAKQQFAMTAMNNLALLLSDVLKQMQANQMSMSGSGKGSKKGNKPSPGMGKKQEELNQQIQQLSKAQKGGQGQGGMSEQLAKMAREQGMLRKMLQNYLDGNKGNEKEKAMGDQIKEMMKKMEESETDLVNKRVNPQLVERQKEILTRLLESEKAMQEQEEDNKRKAEQAKNYDRKIPAQFQQYVKDKQKQTELLRTVPPNLNPYYKREVDNYFKKIK